MWPAASAVMWPAFLLLVISGIDSRRPSSSAAKTNKVKSRFPMEPRTNSNPAGLLKNQAKTGEQLGGSELAQPYDYGQELSEILRTKQSRAVASIEADFDYGVPGATLLAPKYDENDAEYLDDGSYDLEIVENALSGVFGNRLGKKLAQKLLSESREKI